MTDSSTGGGLRQVLVMVAVLGGGGYWYFGEDHANQLVNLIGRTEDPGRPSRQIDYDEDPFTDRRGFRSLDPNRDRSALTLATTGTNTAAGVTTDHPVRHTPGNSADRTGPLRPSPAAANPVVFRGDHVDPSLPGRTAGSNAGSVADSAAGPHRNNDVFPIRHGSYANITVGSWALDGFGPTKLANVDVRRYVAKVVRRFDVMAIQQVAAIERDVVPRLVDEINRGENRYDFIIGPSTGPTGRGEQLAFIYDTTTIEVDRRGSYTVSDPDDRYRYDPLVAWFRTTAPPAGVAWTFSVVNVRIDLQNAAEEVQTLPTLIDAVAGDGRREDDVLVAGLLQADDAYLQPSLRPTGDAAAAYQLAVRHHATDIYDRYQTDNIIIDAGRTTEYLGRGGVLDFARVYNLSQNEAEAISSHLPIHAVFTAHEGGSL